MAVHDVAIATRNPKIRYLCVELLEQMGVDFIVCAPNDRKCESARCIITTESETFNLGIQRTVVISGDFDSDTVAIAVMAKLSDIREPIIAAIGVDPGMRYGLALVIDGNLIYSRILSTPRSASQVTIHWFSISKKIFPETPVHIRIGSGSKLYAALYLREIKQGPSKFYMELVDEHHTTLVGESDKSSAALIAGRRGKLPTDSDMVLELKEGYIRALRRLVTSYTEGQIELQKKDAKSIILGNASIDEFLDHS
ncbi:MAG: hypothetical protein RTU30_05070 [Candidatus Thorarchaeota archaeon]